MFYHMLPIRLTLAAGCAIALLHAAPALAQQAAEVRLTYSNGAFQPSEVRAPADRPVVFRVVTAKSEGVINVRPLKAGRYEFYDDFNEKARGALTVQ
jgi:hypothetical protein